MIQATTTLTRTESEALLRRRAAWQEAASQIAEPFSAIGYLRFLGIARLDGTF